MSEPRYSEREGKSVVEAYAEQIRHWVITDNHRPKRGRRTARVIFKAIQAQGYSGGYGRVCALIRRIRQEESNAPSRKAFVPLAFAHGEAFLRVRLHRRLAPGWTWHIASWWWRTCHRATKCCSMLIPARLSPSAACRDAGSMTAWMKP
jgi:hypothetical protein